MKFVGNLINEFFERKGIDWFGDILDGTTSRIITNSDYSPKSNTIEFIVYKDKRPYIISLFMSDFELIGDDNYSNKKLKLCGDFSKEWTNLLYYDLRPYNRQLYQYELTEYYNNKEKRLLEELDKKTAEIKKHYSETIQCTTTPSIDKIDRDVIQNSLGLRQESEIYELTKEYAKLVKENRKKLQAIQKNLKYEDLYR